MAENDSIPSEENMVIENAGWLYFCPWYGDHLMSSQYNDAAQLKKMYTSDYCITLDELPKDLYGNAEPGTTVTTDATTDTTAETTTETETTATTYFSVVTTTEDTAETTVETTVSTADTEESTETTVSETTEAVETTVESSATETSADTTATTASETTVTTKGAVEAATLYGDINLDGRVDITDAVLLNKAAANAVSLSAQQKANADCDESGEVDSNDAVVLLKFLVSIIHTLPNKGE
ncbi:MAG: dockerin type I repeat-containing protein [Ruminococcus callidus]|nr:dockerin type I repeat-containing protein [Ruminococcus callidus]